jgi:hypothetical protein
MNLRVVRWPLWIACFICAANIVIHFISLMDAYRLTSGNDGDGVNDLYNVIDVQIWQIGQFVGIAVCIGLAIYCLRKRTTN